MHDSEEVPESEPQRQFKGVRGEGLSEASEHLFAEGEGDGFCDPGEGFVIDGRDSIRLHTDYKYFNR